MTVRSVEFAELKDGSAAQLIFYYEPGSGVTTQANFLTAGLSTRANMYSITSFINGKWSTLAGTGHPANLEPSKPYELRVLRHGSNVSLNVNGVAVLHAVLPFPVPNSQVGIWCTGYKDIRIRDFTLATQEPEAFVVMQFTPPYDELHDEVITKVCDRFGLRAHRADETYGPGVIITDIAQQIQKSTIVIAELTETNPNVYYEVGYAHALGKPSILIAEKGTKLPFDVAPFRTLFYENTISGKKRIEAGLAKHLEAILGPAQK